MSDEPHIHEWGPMQGWSAHYRCPICGAIGYKHGPVLSDSGGMYRGHDPDLISPYSCSSKDCKAPAITKEPSKSNPYGPRVYWRCSKHRNKDYD